MKRNAMAKFFPYYLPGSSVSKVDTNIVIQTRHYHPLAAFLIFVFNLMWLFTAVVVIYFSLEREETFTPVIGVIMFSLAAWGSAKALKLLLNRITFTFTTEGLITRTEGPIRTSGSNWERPAKNVDQFYLARKEVKNEGKAWYTYHGLSMKMKDGEELSILPKSTLTTYRRAKALEELLESHLGIIDRRIKGEYDPDQEVGTINDPDPMQYGRRAGDRVRKVLTPDLHLMKHRDIIVIENVDFQVSQAYQYSWENGQTDQWVELQENEQNLVGIFFEQELGEYRAFRSRQLDLAEAVIQEAIKPTSSFSWNDKVFYAQSFKSGTRHLRWQVEEQQAIQQYTYQTEDMGSRLRLQINSATGKVQAFGEQPLPHVVIQDFLVWT